MGSTCSIYPRSKNIHKIIISGEIVNSLTNNFESFKGERILCRDVFYSKYTNEKMYRWRDAEIIKVKDKIIEIQFIGWSNKHNIELNLDNKEDFSRIAPLGMLSSEDAASGKELSIRDRDLALSYFQNGKDSFVHGDSKSDDISNLKYPPSDKFHKQGYFIETIKDRKPVGKFKNMTPSNSENWIMKDDSVETKLAVNYNQDNNKKNEPSSPAQRIRKYHRRQSFPGSKVVQRTSTFEERMASVGLHIVQVIGDGNCLYRAIAHQFYLDENRHQEIRLLVHSHLAAHRDRFQPFCSINYDDFLKYQEESGNWADDIELKALEEVFDRPIVIYDSESINIAPMKTNFDENGSDENESIKPIILSYHGHQHYNSVFNEKFSLPLIKRSSSKILNKRKKSMSNILS